ncbi:beta-glucosidase BglX [Paenibacillus antibioticophila]|uniref:beta-glucosidase BglX n=1 Tax=Paenibacillus antibioticophila TaxID=1274374 RepID=UPI00067776FA|nr:beta-glucosidase BglX [Paenibacillus antibioticophila]
MFGIWNSTINVSETATMKFIFQIEELNDIQLRIWTEPVPMIEIEETIVENNHLFAKGHNKYMPGEITFNLYFNETSFSGEINMMNRSFQIIGEKGRGTVQSKEYIAAHVKNKRKSNLSPRGDKEIEMEVEKILNKMSLDDKIGQMSQCLASNHSFGGAVNSAPPEQLISEGKAGSVLGAFDINRIYELQKIAVEQSPHKIPLFFNADIIHGFQTIFPVPLAWSCSWDMELIKQACAIAAKEATASGNTFNHGPMVDLTRDPRWGRVVEGSGEDPYLGAQIAKAQVGGFQGESLFDEETLIACLKHFIGYGGAEGGRDYNTVDMSEWTLRNFHLPAFQAGIEAGAGSVMNAFNFYQGVPVAGNGYLLRELLRKELGFKGMLISDYGSIEEIQIHGAARDKGEAAKMAIDATMDIEMVTSVYADELPSLVEKGTVKQKQLDDAVRRILTYKFKIGIMDDPYRYIQPEKEELVHLHPEHLNKSRELARKSVVLLKNSGVLPLSKDRKIAVIGPFGASRDLLGPWQFTKYAYETITLLQGISSKGVEKSQIVYSQGCDVEAYIENGIEDAVKASEESDIVILALGESSDMSGEAASRTNISLPEVQMRLAKAVVAVGKPVVLVLTNGRPILLDWFEQHTDAIVETWFLGTQAGYAIADVLFGDYNPSGKLTMSFPHNVGQIPVYYNHFRTGRPLTDNQDQKYLSKYIDSPNEPLYPFGYGLSYSFFEYANLRLDRQKIMHKDILHASVTVTNTGRYAGEEIVQLYIQDSYGSTVRPVKELKGFCKVWLESGESQEVIFQIGEKDLVYYTGNQRYEAESGEFKIFIGSNSRDVLEAGFELLEAEVS